MLQRVVDYRGLTASTGFLALCLPRTTQQSNRMNQSLLGMLPGEHQENRVLLAYLEYYVKLAAEVFTGPAVREICLDGGNHVLVPQR